MLVQFEKHGITYRAVIQYVINEMTKSDDALVYYMSYISRMGITTLANMMIFASTKQAGEIKTEFAENIQGTKNWNGLYEILLSKNKFRRRINKKIKSALEKKETELLQELKIASLQELPRRVRVPVGGVLLVIKNHRVQNESGIFLTVLNAAKSVLWPRSVMVMESNGINYGNFAEAAIQEIKQNYGVVEGLVGWYHRIKKNSGNALEFSKSDAGRKIAGQYIARIKRCKNWTEFHKAMKKNSKFQKEMKQKIMEEMKQWHKA